MVCFDILSQTMSKSIKKGLHPRNPHRKRYDFKALIESFPPLEPFVSQNKFGDFSIDFSNPDSTIWVFEMNQWKSGALQGNQAEDAFFVKVGLGQTMSEQDVLNGKMIVEVGLAAVRPAEFIVLRFTHHMTN